MCETLLQSLESILCASERVLRRGKVLAESEQFHVLGSCRFAGGAEPVTAGMILACSDPECNLQCLVSEYEGQGDIAYSQLTKVILS